MKEIHQNIATSVGVEVAMFFAICDYKYRMFHYISKM